MLSVVSLVFWLAVIPFCIGLIPAAFISSEKRSLGFVLLAGYFGMWALFELAAVPAVLWVEYRNFRVASAVFTVLSLFGAAVGICLLYRNARAGKPGLIAGSGLWRGAGKKNDTIVTMDGGLKARVAALTKRLPAGESAFWILFFVLLGFQLYKAVAFASFDGDDAYYVVESLIAQEADVMYRILPLTGGSTGLDVRTRWRSFPCGWLSSR